MQTEKMTMNLEAVCSNAVYFKMPGMRRKVLCALSNRQANKGNTKLKNILV